jgi:hypothetical protein
MLIDVIKTCENLNVEEQHELTVFLQKLNIFLMEHYENSTCNNEQSSLQLMDPNCKLVHASSYTVPKSA